MAARLHALGGEPPPDDLVRDLSLVAGFSEAARAALWSVLGPCLTDPIPRSMNQAIDDFGRAHGIAGSELARAVRACRVLVRGAALLDLPPAALAEDAAAVAGAPVAEMLLSGYDAARAQIREVAVAAALAEHGRVLDGVDWRLDQVMTSSAGGRLRFPVAVLTLRCTASGRDERFTVQVMPERLREIQAICDALLGRRT